MELKIRDNRIELINGPRLVWQLDIGSIKLIGEYTDVGGPFVEDYFFVFADRHENVLQAFNSDITDPNSFWPTPSNLLGTTVTPELANSIGWRTSILFPKHLHRQPLFDVISEKNHRRTFFSKLFGTNRQIERTELTEAARKALEKGL